MIAPVTTTDAVVAHLKERLRRGEFPPGGMLPSERELKEQLGVSRLTLREALARLSALGIIRVAHGKGSFVAERPSPAALHDALVPLLPRDDPDRWRELAEARALVEGDLAARAARRRTVEDLARLRMILDAPPEDLDDPHAFAERDLSFHREVARIAGNTFLSVMWEALASEILVFLAEAAVDRAARRAALRRHRPLLEAVAARDAEAARSLSRTHIEPFLAYYEKVLKKKGGHP